MLSLALELLSSDSQSLSSLLISEQDENEAVEDMISDCRRERAVLYTRYPVRGGARCRSPNSAGSRVYMRLHDRSHVSARQPAEYCLALGRDLLA